MTNSAKVQKKISQDYWVSKFSNTFENHPKPFSSYKASRIDIAMVLDQGATRSIDELGKGNDHAKYVMYLSNLQLLLQKQFPDEKVMIRTPKWAAKSVSGERANSVYFDIDADENRLFNAFLNDVKTEVQNSLRNSNYDVNDLTEALKNSDIDLNKLMFFDFSYGDLNTGQEGNECDFFVGLESVNNSIKLILSYNESLFPFFVAEPFLKSYEYLLSNIKLNFTLPLKEIDVLPPNQFDQLIHGFNNVKSAVENKGTIIDLFEANVGANSNSLALIADKSKISYGDLNIRANKLANYLKDQYSIKPGQKVGILLDSSDLLVTSILGVLKSGAAFVPINTALTQNKIDYIIENSQVNVLITYFDNLANFQTFEKPIFAIDIELDVIDASTENPESCIDEKSEAYVIYTSGSTGNPKGVVVEHSALLNYVNWAAKKYVGNKESISFPLFTSIAFDLTFTSVFTPLATSNSIVVYGGKNAGIMLDKILADDMVDIIKLTPSHLKLIRHKRFNASRIKTIIVGGELFETDLASDIYHNFNAQVDLYNEYGPTEAVVGCMIYKYNPIDKKSKSVPIGIPSDNNSIYVLDKNLKPTPIGAIGELYISGKSLSKGYYNNPELTNNAFLNNPFIEGERMYKSGDKARMLENLTMEYVGRSDDQIKFNGYRIEPLEIVAEVLGYDTISACHIEIFSPEKDAQENVLNCVKCGMPSNYPDITFDETGTCDVCVNFESYKGEAEKFFKTEKDLVEIFEANKLVKPNDYDCLMLLSGGKDSTYVLYQLVKEMGLNVLVFSFDNGFISQGAKENINRTVKDLDCDFVMGTTSHINEIFVESLNDFSNVCNGCYKTIYTLSIKLALEKNIKYIVTGLSRGQLFETRLDELYRNKIFDVKTVDKSILDSRLSYHRINDVVLKTLSGDIFEDDNILEKVQFLDFYRYTDVVLENLYAYIDVHAAWVRPSDTGRSTNCLINDLGILIHKKKLGYHNYALPYSWDVRMGHKVRESALDELDDEIDLLKMTKIMDEIGYVELASDDKYKSQLVGYITSNDEVNMAKLKRHLASRLPEYMIPSDFIQLSEFPLTPNGKINKNQLPKPGDEAESESLVAYVAPTNEYEEKLIQIWEDVLGKNKIGIHDNFFNLNGHSLKAVVMVAKVHQEFKKEIQLRDVFDSPVLKDLANFIKELDSSEFNEIARAPVQENYALSSSQKRMWILSQFEEASTAYNVVSTFGMEGNLNKTSLVKAFDDLIDRHEILRTVFKENENGEVRQHILPTDELGFVVNQVDLCKFSGEEKTRKIKESIDSTNAVFSLSEGPLMRITLIQIEEEKYILASSMQHIISDDWTTRIILTELMALYNAYENKEPSPLEPLRIQYKDYAEWEQTEAINLHLAKSKEYWVKQFENEIPVLELPTDKKRPEIKTYQGGLFNAVIRKNLTDDLKNLCQKEEASLYMGLLSVLNTLFYKYTNNEDIILGSAITSRDHIDLKNQCGLYLNTLPLRTEFKGSEGFEKLLLRTKEVALKGYEHMLYPFDELVHELQIERDLSKNALFDVSVILHADEGEEANKLGNLNISEYGVERNVSLFDLSFYFIEQNNELNLAIEYNTDIFEESSIIRLSAHLQQIIRSVTQQPKVPISQIDYLMETEIEEILSDSRKKINSIPEGLAVLKLFSEQVNKMPNNTAIEFDGVVLTYRELDQKANLFAKFLLENHLIEINDSVGLQMERSEQLMVALIGTMKAGATFVMLSQALSNEYRDHIVEDSNCKILINESEFERYIKFENEFSGVDGIHESKLSDIAYIRYDESIDSKLVSIKIDQFNFLNSCQFLNSYLKITEKDNGFQFNSIGTDAFIWEVFPLLICGANVHIINEAYKNTPMLLKDFITENNISYAILPSERLHSSQIGHSDLLKKLIVIGDLQFQSQIVDFAPENMYYNIYSPNRSGIIASIQKIEKSNIDFNDDIILGESIWNTRFYVLDNDLKILPSGVNGNVYLELDGQANSYAKVNNLESVIENPFKENSFLYNTGDRGKILSNGQTVYSGSNEEEVEINGSYIHLAKIEDCIVSAEVIKKSAVTVVYDRVLNKKQIVAFYAFEELIEKGEDRKKKASTLIENIKVLVENNLPPCMVPSVYIEMPNLAFSRSKIIKSKLEETYQMPIKHLDSNTTVKEDNMLLADIWARILQVDQRNINAQDNFFDLGGKSMMFIQLKTSISKQYNVKIELKDLFLNPVFSEQVAIINSLKASKDRPTDTIYFIPPIFGNPIVYMSIIEQISATYDTHAFQYLGLEEGESFFTSINQAAQYFCDKVVANKNEGKIIVFGYSMGGNIAFEMVKILEQKYTDIDLLIVDSTASLTIDNKRKVNGIQQKMTDEVYHEQAKELVNILDNEQFKNNENFEKFIVNNFKIADKYQQTGKIKSDVYFIKTEAVCLEFEDWKHYTSGKTKLDYLNGGHWTALEKVNDPVFVNLLMSISLRNAEAQTD